MTDNEILAQKPGTAVNEAINVVEFAVAKKKRSAGITFVGPSRTKQEYADSCDISKIVKKYAVLDQPIPVKFTASYGDTTCVGDLRASIERVRLAEEQFMSLPAEVRQRCANDPVVFMSMLNDPSQADYLVSKGVLERQTVQPIVEVATAPVESSKAVLDAKD